MSIDVAALLTPLSEDAPAGENLEYDADYIELGTVSQRKPDQQFGDVKVPGEEPDWEDVERRAIAVLERTRDLRPAVILTQALLRNDGLPGFRDALSLIDGYLEHLWGAVHPQLDPDDDNDPTMRVNLLSTLCNVAAVLKPLRDAALARSRVFGPVSLTMISAVVSDAPPPPSDGYGDESTEVQGPKGPSRADIEAIFMDCDLEQFEATTAALDECLRLAGHIESVMTDQVGAGNAIDMSALVATLKEAQAEVRPWLARRKSEGGGDELASEAAGGEAEAGAASEATAAGGGARPAPRATRAGVHSREDAVRAIEEIITYFRDSEPTSPVPLLLGRAKRWVSMDFLAILEDFSPDAAREAEKLRGTLPE